VQIMRFRDRRQQSAVHAAERTDPAAQAIIADFCKLINFPYQQQQGLFVASFYRTILPVGPEPSDAGEAEAEAAAPAGEPSGLPMEAEDTPSAL
jgi:hypothetical protein